ncbi:MAG: hypothetical protein HOL06_02525, partial [Rhodospirillaceae bacterium]|nr:hypothetical protein [Rhodospirillaceae bacterium]
GALSLAPFIGLHEGLLYWGVMISPALEILTLWVLFWATRPLLSSGWFLLMAVLFATQPALRAYFLIARPDHHSLQIFLYAALFALMLRSFMEKTPTSRFFLAGGIAALALWVSIEALVPIFSILATLGLLWLWPCNAQSGGEVAGDEVVRRGYLTALIRFLQGIALFLLPALAIERVSFDWLSVVYDRLSIVHVVLFGLTALTWIGIGRAEAKLVVAGRGGLLLRLGLTALGIILPLFVIGIIFPDFFKGPFAEVDPRIMGIWFDRISEVQPLLKGDFETTGRLIFMLGPGFLALAATAWAFWRGSTVPRPASFYVFLSLVLFTVLGLYQVRWASYAELIAVLPWTILLAATMAWRGGWHLKSGVFVPLRSGLFLIVLLAHFILGGVCLKLAEESKPTDEPPVSESEKKKDTCQWPVFATAFSNPLFDKGRPLTLFSFTHQGPEILYRTGHKVVGTPYHRNAAAILDTHDVLSALDIGAAHDILARRKVDYVVLCTDSPEARVYREMPGETLFARLEAGTPPPWLRPVPLNGKAGVSFRLFEMVD